MLKYGLIRSSMVNEWLGEELFLMSIGFIIMQQSLVASQCNIFFREKSNQKKGGFPKANIVFIFANNEAAV